MTAKEDKRPKALVLDISAGLEHLMKEFCPDVFSKLMNHFMKPLIQIKGDLD